MCFEFVQIEVGARRFCLDALDYPGRDDSEHKQRSIRFSLTNCACE
ncbi:hypothetical protein M758_2G102600 [Ceratodon purpureus]|nr:hypothetical protein M758_2G102600 [Ceratodon purpureus]